MPALAHSAPEKGGQPQLYAEHVVNCRTLAQAHASNISLYAKENSNWNSWLPSIQVAGEWHDLGKLDLENQKALRAGRGHSLTFDHIDAGVSHTLNNEKTDLAAAWLIRAHHSPGLPSLITEKLRGTYFLRGLRHGGDNDAEHQKLVERNDAQLRTLVEKHLQNLSQSSCAPQKSEPKHGIGARIALSCLVDADHSDTANFDQKGSANATPPIKPDPRWAERLEKLTTYIKEKQSEGKGDPDRNRMRQNFFEGCLRGARLDANLITCEATVGLGKTTSVLAYLLRQAIAKRLRRIIIVAPFTNILRQTANTLKSALLLPGENEEDVILQHHHRAEFSDQQFRHLAVTWNSPIILTTAVQFFETLASNHPGALRKLHRLPGSAIFIDEAHASLPYDLWPQCFEWLRELSGSWTCPTALVSGSQIRFWEHEWGRPLNKKTLSIPEITSFEVLDYGRKTETFRCRFEHIELPMSCESLAERTNKNLDKNRNQLVILNTVHSAAGFARAMSERLDQKNTYLKKRRVLHLSTLLSPEHREQVLKEIERRANCIDFNESWLLVATSCVESGVDLDFHDGFREDASVSSLIQTSGRINRHGLFRDSILTRITLASDSAFRPHPQFRTSARILDALYPYLVENKESLSAVSTEAAKREIAESPKSSRATRLPKHEDAHEYPLVAELCKVIQSNTETVVVNSAIADSLRKHRPVHQQELINNSVQIWGNKLDSLGLEIIRVGDSKKIYYASNASYDPELLGLGRGVLASTESKVDCLVL